MNVFYISLALAQLLIASVGMGYLRHGGDSAVKRQQEPQRRFERRQRHG